MDKKELNKIYYEKNKADIAAKLYHKEKCEMCGRVVSHQNINKHKNTKYCRTHHEKQNDIELLNKVKNNIEVYSAIENILKTLK